jgi:hypothetical protein
MIFYYCALFLAFVVLLYFNYKNDYKRIERYYFNQNKRLYYLLRAVHFILIASIILNARFILYSYTHNIFEKYNK